MTTVPTTRTNGSRALRVVLVALGSASAFVAANVAFGGLDTLGLQGSGDYFEVTDPEAFALRDSHARFYGGVYLGLSIFLIVAATNVRKYQSALTVVFTLIFLGGVSRLTQSDLSVTFGADLGFSTIVELVGMPALAAWVAHATKPKRATSSIAATFASPA